MAAADSNAEISTTWRRLDKDESWYNLGANGPAIEGNSDSYFGGDRRFEWHVLLVLAAPLPPGCRRFPVGHPRCSTSARAAKSLRHAVGAVSPHRDVVRNPVCPAAARR